jgi:translation elongation factor EF-Ts
MDKIGVMTEINCETDFVAGPMTSGTGKDIGSISPPPILPIFQGRGPQDVIQRKRRFTGHRLRTNHPGNREDNRGKLEKFFSETCLLNRYSSRTGTEEKVKDIITEKVASLEKTSWSEICQIPAW